MTNQIIYCPKCKEKLEYKDINWQSFDDEYFLCDWDVSCRNCGDAVVRETYILKEAELEWNENG